MKYLVKIVLILLIILQFQVQSRPLQAKKVKLAINCGSLIDKRDHRGFVYDEDKYYDEQSQMINYGKMEEYKDELLFYSHVNQIHFTQRYSENLITYKLPLSKFPQQKYVLILRFMEFQYARAGKRLFNVILGDQIVIKNLDVASQHRGGKFYAHEEYIEFHYRSPTQIFWKKPLSQESYIIDLNEDGTLNLQFQGVKDQPIINAIILYEGEIYDTNKYELQMEKEQWEKANREKLRAKYLEKKAKEEEEQIERRNRLQQKQMERRKEQMEKGEIKREIPPFHELLMTPFGVVAMIGFFGSSFVLIYFTFFDPYGIEKEERERQKLPMQNKNNYNQVQDQSFENQLTQRKIDE